MTGGASFVGGGFEYDIFLSYAWADNDDASGNWVAGFLEALQARLNRRLGRDVQTTVFFNQRTLGRNADFGPQIEQALHSSATMLAVVSRAWVESPNCRDELTFFDESVVWGPVSQSGRLFLVRLEPEQLSHDWPDPYGDDFRRRLSGVIGWDFHSPVPGAPAGRPMPTQDMGYLDALTQLVERLAATLTSLRQIRRPLQPAPISESVIQLPAGESFVEQNKVRTEFVRSLKSLTPANFDTLLTMLQGSPPSVAAQGAVRLRAERLVEWAESPIGPGLARIRAVFKRLQNFINPETPRERPVRILHLSDFHFQPDRAWDADPVLKGLASAVHGLQTANLAPDVVAITGDLAFSGRPDEYEYARGWIDRELLPALPQGFDREQILTVPGNHDVDRDEVKIVAESVQARLLDIRDQQDIAKVLADPSQRDVMLRRHSAYLEAASCYGPVGKTVDVPWWSTAMEFGKTTVHFAGLCSTWMSSSDGDHGRLLVGQWQVHEVLKRTNEADIVVVLMHHPWSFLTEFDANIVEHGVRQSADVFLRGHLHQQQSRIVQCPDWACLELAAGAAYSGSQYPNAWQLVEIFPQAKIVRVHYRRWHNGQWIVDRNAFLHSECGFSTFSLSGRTT